MAPMTSGSYVVNDEERPIRFGQVEIVNRESRASLSHDAKQGIQCQPVITSFCGSDYEYLKMGRRLAMGHKFPPGTQRLINGHEGVLYVPEWDRFAVLSVRGGASADPSRFTDSETYFECGCDSMDGMMCQEGFFNPDLLIPLPDEWLGPKGRLPLSLAKKLCLSDPVSCVMFQKERIEDILPGHRFRLHVAEGLSEEAARRRALEEGFRRIVVFGCGGTGLPAAMLLPRGTETSLAVVARASEDTPKVRLLKKHTDAVYLRSNVPEPALAEGIVDALGGKATVFFGASGTELESRIAFDHGVLGNNGIYVSFSVGPTLQIDTMPFGFKNQLVFGAINFRKQHMSEAIHWLKDSPMDELVRIYPLGELARDPMAFYHRVYVKDRGVVKAAVIWREGLVNMQA